jgi:hypothetical protein
LILRQSIRSCVKTSQLLLCEKQESILQIFCQEAWTASGKIARKNNRYFSKFTLNNEQAKLPYYFIAHWLRLQVKITELQ